MKPGVTLTPEGASFAVWSENAETLTLCLFDDQDRESRHPMQRGDDHVHRITVPGTGDGARYGFRASGVYDPERGLWFGPSKLLLDPYATEIDRPFVYDAKLAHVGHDTAALMPKAIVRAHTEQTPETPRFRTGGLVYELAVRAFTKLHPGVPEALRGTVAALAQPAVIAHLKEIGVDTVELMPITAWIDERHLPPLGLTNSWGYNPVGFMALDPRIVPGGVRELRDTVEALHGAGIGVILDLVFNHTGESDRAGPTLSLRGLDSLASFRHVDGQPDTLVNDTGTGNTVACDHPFIRRLIVDSLRHFVLAAGIDGFRFDLAPILGRSAHGFSTDSETLRAITEDAVLADRILIAEPWDIGPGGYQLGNFPAPFLEWNDRARDDMRRFWRGDRWTIGNLATRLAGSSDIFARHAGDHTRSVNFLAAHDGFTLMDTVSYENRHNHANGEENRDGHHDNFSWNNGAEGETGDETIIDARRRDVMAMLSTLFISRGTIMLTAGDEGGRSQKGNNNAYCQDNAITWLDWDRLDRTLVAHTAQLSAIRRRFSTFSETGFFTAPGDEVDWLNAEGAPMAETDWHQPDAATMAMLLTTMDNGSGTPARLAVIVNRDRDALPFLLPDGEWRRLDDGQPWAGTAPARSVTLCIAAPQHAPTQTAQKL